MTHRWLRTVRRHTHVRTALLVLGSALVLTMAFVGVLAFLEGATPGVRDRVPWYFVAGGALFVTAVFLLESGTAEGGPVIVAAVVATLTGVALTVLAVEGLIFALRRPDEVLVSSLVLYFVAAGLLATGFGYWTLNHWREFAGE